MVRSAFLAVLASLLSAQPLHLRPWHVEMGYAWFYRSGKERQVAPPGPLDLDPRGIFLRARKAYFAPRGGMGWFFGAETFSWSFSQGSFLASYLPPGVQIVPDSQGIWRSIACRGVEVGFLGRWVRGRWGALSGASLYLLSTRVAPLSVPFTDGSRFVLQPTLNTFVGFRASLVGVYRPPDEENVVLTLGLHWPFLWGRPAPVLARHQLPDGSTVAQTTSWYLHPRFWQVSVGMLFKSPL